MTMIPVSGLLDAVDGHAARLLGQSSKFGAMLDMLTDRCATMCLLTTLATFYPSFMFFFQLSMIIDISCHWLHVHTALLQVTANLPNNAVIVIVIVNPRARPATSLLTRLATTG